MERSGEVCCAHCTCMAGLGEACTHVAAVRFYLETAVRITRQPTCTQQECQWLIPAFHKHIPYLRIKDIDFSPNSKKNKIDHSTNSPITSSAPSRIPAQQNVIPPNSTELKSFFEKLSQYETKPAVLSVVPHFSGQHIPKARSGTFPSPLQSLYNSKYLTLNYTELLLACDSIDINISSDIRDKSPYLLKSLEIALLFLLSSNSFLPFSVLIAGSLKKDTSL